MEQKSSAVAGPLLYCIKVKPGIPASLLYEPVDEAQNYIHPFNLLAANPLP